MRFTLTVNGAECQAEGPDGVSLPEVLRDHLGITGPKPGCGEGARGACAVLIGSRAVQACQLPAAEAAGRRITSTTIGWPPCSRRPRPGSAGPAVPGLAARPARWKVATGTGIALGMEKDGRVATAACVRVAADGTVRLLRVVTAVDCGAVIYPDGLANQVEGAVVMGLGRLCSSGSTSPPAASRTGR